MMLVGLEELGLDARERLARITLPAARESGIRVGLCLSGASCGEIMASAARDLASEKAATCPAWRSARVPGRE